MVAITQVGGEPHSTFYYRGRSNSCAAYLVRIDWLAAAPWSVWQCSGCATSHSGARSSGRRGSGTRKTWLQVFGRGHVSRPGRRLQRPSDWWKSGRTNHQSPVRRAQCLLRAGLSPVRRAQCLLRAGPFGALDACSGQAFHPFGALNACSGRAFHFSRQTPLATLCHCRPQ